MSQKPLREQDTCIRSVRVLRPSRTAGNPAGLFTATGVGTPRRAHDFLKHRIIGDPKWASTMSDDICSDRGTGLCLAPRVRRTTPRCCRPSSLLLPWPLDLVGGRMLGTSDRGALHAPCGHWQGATRAGATRDHLHTAVELASRTLGAIDRAHRAWPGVRPVEAGRRRCHCVRRHQLRRQ